MELSIKEKLIFYIQNLSDERKLEAIYTLLESDFDKSVTLSKQIIKERIEHVKSKCKKFRLKDLNTSIVGKPLEIKAAILKALGAKTEKTFYDILNGERKLNYAEKKAIAEIYQVKLEDIEWDDNYPG